MSALKNISVAFMLCAGIIAFSGCGSGQQNKSNDDTEQNEEINARLIEEKNELQQMAKDGFSEINRKIMELNEKIKKHSEPLTDKQNETLDEIQDLRVDLNNMLHKVKNVSEDQWESFQGNFKKELEELQEKVDGILDEF